MGLFCFELSTNCWSDIWFIVWIFYFSLNYGMRSHVDHILFLSPSVSVSLCPCLVLSHSHLHTFGQPFLLFVVFCLLHSLPISFTHHFFSHLLSACLTHSFTIYLAIFRSRSLTLFSLLALAFFFRTRSISMCIVFMSVFG